MLEQEKPRTSMYASGYGHTPTQYINKALRETIDRDARWEAIDHNYRHPFKTKFGRKATQESVLMQQAEDMDKAIEEERKKPLIGKLAFNMGRGEDTRLIELEMRGGLEEAQDFALRTVIEAEGAPNMDLVRNAEVTMADGNIQSWQEFTAPAIARQMPGQKVV